MNQSERMYFLATLESLETAFNAQIKALRAVIALSQNEMRVAPAVQEDTIKELEEEFENIFSLGAEE